MILVALGSSAQLLMTGILGEYVGRIYEEVKRRPLYVVASEINLAQVDGQVDGDAAAFESGGLCSAACAAGSCIRRQRRAHGRSMLGPHHEVKGLRSLGRARSSMREKAHPDRRPRASGTR